MTGAPKPDAVAGDCWMWPEGAGVRWWTPAETGVLAIELPGDPAIVGQRTALRDHGTRVPLAQALDAGLAKRLETLLRQYPGGLRLHLSHDLPTDWQGFPFQWLTWRSRGLMGRLLVTRFAPRLWDPPAQPHSREAAILNLWPSTDAGRRRGPFGNLGALDGVQVLIGAGPARHFIRHADLSQFSLLGVIAHGSELPGDRPFRLADGTLWSLPEDERLPPVVLLLACGDDRHNLLEYGRTLLDAGAQCVLAPMGRLDADAADAFLRTFLARWQAGARVSEILRQTQAKPAGRYGADSIELIGRGDLRLARTVEARDRSDDELAAAAGLDPAAMTALANRITLRCFQTEGDIEEAPARLYRALNVELGDARREAPLLHVLDALEERLWPLSRAWVLPMLARLAEEYNHSLLAEYEDIHRQVAGSLPGTAFTHLGWSKIYYRLGRDLVALEELGRGLNRLQPQSLCEPGGVALLTQLALMLADLDLPHSGQLVYDALDQCLQGQGEAIHDHLRRNRMLLQARLHLRRGELAAAGACLRIQHEEDLRNGDPAWHELSWLLYLAGWRQSADGRAYADRAKTILGDVHGNTARLGPGNSDCASLLRALALWAWRSGDGEAAALAACYVPALRERLYMQDPGPFGMALAFLALDEKQRGRAGEASACWAEAMSVLQARHYWLDVAALSWLHGERKEAGRALRRFQQQRKSLLRVFRQFPEWLIEGGLNDLPREAACRAEEESALLAPAAGPDPDRLVAQGLVPV